MEKYQTKEKSLEKLLLGSNSGCYYTILIIFEDSILSELVLDGFYFLGFAN